MSDFPETSKRLHVLSSYDRDSAGKDSFFHTGSTLASGAWGTANRALFYPFSVRTPYSIKKFWWANGAAVSGNVDVGIYTMGGARLLSVGGVAQAGLNVIQSAAPTAGPPWRLIPGSYYMAIVASSATATFFGNLPGGMSISEQVLCGYAQQLTAYPLPDPATLVTISVSGFGVPLFGMSDLNTI